MRTLLLSVMALCVVVATIGCQPAKKAEKPKDQKAQPAQSGLETQEKAAEIPSPEPPVEKPAAPAEKPAAPAATPAPAEKPAATPAPAEKPAATPAPAEKTCCNSGSGRETSNARRQTSGGCKAGGSKIAGYCTAGKAGRKGPGASRKEVV